MAELGMEISKTDFLIYGHRVEIFGPSFTEYKCLS